MSTTRSHRVNGRSGCTTTRLAGTVAIASRTTVSRSGSACRGKAVSIHGPVSWSVEPVVTPGTAVVRLDLGCLIVDHLRDFERITPARVPTRGSRVDIFAPETVVWAYEGPPRQALRALLGLVHPAASRRALSLTTRCQ